VTNLEAVFRQGQGEAGFILGFLHSPDNVILSDKVKLEIGATQEKAIGYFQAAYPVLTREALTGNGKSMHLIALYYQIGLPPVSHDQTQYEHWKNKAIEAGYRGAGQL
jgi:TPR repeat protein